MGTVKELQEKSAKLREFFDQYLPYERPDPVLADFVKVQHELMWGGVWQTQDLDLRLKSFATISAQCVNGYDFGIEHQVRTGLTIGITPVEIKEIFIQLLFYVGIPATVFGLLVSQDVINERQEWKTLDTSEEWEWLPSVREKLEAGNNNMSETWGPTSVDEISGSIARKLVPEAAQIVDAYNFGEIWRRTILTNKERLVCVLAALMSRGHISQLKQYTRYALSSGVSADEICGIFAQAGWYRGWPHVETALSAVAELLTTSD
ncbi:MAG: hypothetical protein CL886_08075 [Dehalococcoidia bacterium]|nr:hypothetical protein [Dehalococcoidia bacterium]|tara:strand:+ start:3302 stop:4090 length:789 start_codon:yes stop_codon:yes gene_type:complete